MEISTKFNIGDKVIYKDRICEIDFIKIKYTEYRLTYRIYDHTDGFGYDALESELTKFEEDGNKD